MTITRSIRGLVAVALMSAGLGMGAGPAAQAADTELLVNVFVPPRHFLWKAMRAWKRDVEEVTQGRVAVNFPPKGVSPPNKQLDAVVNGVADGAISFNGFLANKAVLPLMSHLPWTYRDDSVATSVALWRTYQRYFADKDELDNVEVLSLFTFAGSGYCSTTDAPITSVADIKERKMWALPGTAANILKGLDASFVSSPAVKIHEYVSRNTVEGYTGITFNSIVAFKAASSTKSCVLFDRKINNSSFSFFVNKDRWAEISAADQEAIRQVSGEKLARGVAELVNAAENKATKAAIEEYGIEIIEPSPAFVADLEKAAAPLIDNWIKAAGNKGVDGRAALDFYLAEVERIAGS